MFFKTPIVFSQVSLLKDSKKAAAIYSGAKYPEGRSREYQACLSGIDLPVEDIRTLLPPEKPLRLRRDGCKGLETREIQVRLQCIVLVGTF